MAILRLARTEPELGKSAVSDRLQQSGLNISASGVRYIWQKHGLETTVKRLQALLNDPEQKVTLTEKQQRLLERGLLSSQLAQGEKSSARKKGKVAASGETVGRRNILLNTAAELFAEQGYDRTSMRDIASKAGLLPGSVYHHFASKEELYLTIHQEGLHIVRERVINAAAKGSDPWDSLIRAFTVHIECMVGNTTAVQRLTGHGLAMTGRRDILDKIRADREAYENVIRELIAKLPLKPDADRSLLRLTLLGATNWVYVWYQEGKKSPKAIATGMINMIRHGADQNADPGCR
ncbi:MAG: TetR/AcrR family transcriptional regulator [Thiolinea sp.]